MPPMKILHLEDSPEDAELVGEILAAEWPGCEIAVVCERPDCLASLRRGGHDLILSDFSLVCFNGLEALKLAQEHAPDIPFIFLSGTIGEDRAISALQAGAADYVLKGGMKRLVPAIRRSLREHEDRRKRREAENRIHEQAEMLNQAREAIVITDLENRVIYWNAGAERLLGWKSAEALGRTAEQLYGGEAPTDIRAASRQTTERGEWQGELRLHNRQGHAVVLESRRTLVRDEKGNPKAHLSINSDITEKRHLEEQLLRVQRMENIGLLAAGIAHDLNNVLTPILMAAPMLRERAIHPSDIKMLTVLEKSAERGAGLVRQILSFAHGASGERRLLQVRHLTSEIAAVITEAFPKNIRFEHHIPGNLWPINANSTQIHQVLLNLCINARDAMPEGGTLSLRVENIDVDETMAQALPAARVGPHILLEVKDTGTGIPPEVLERMWEPFFTTKAEGKGTGLGLSTVRGIIENHDGFVGVTTAPGKGTCFRVYLPAADPSAGVASAAPVQPLTRGHGELILVVDDEKSVRDVTSAILTRSGYRVISAGDGAEGMAIFAQRLNQVSLVISDMQMPNFDGAALARVLQRIDPAVKILAMSGLSAGGTNNPTHQSVNFGRDFLRKPFKAEALLDKVSKLIHSTA